MERRSKMRYPVEVGVQYRSVKRKSCICGTGQTTNLSSSGVLVATQQAHRLRAGATVDLKIEWASPLHKTIPLNLIATGRVVRCGQSSFAVTFVQHEFRVVRGPLQKALAVGSWH